MPRATEDKPEAPGPSDPVVRLSILVACAAVLQVAESLLPHPVPGVRLGLANIITVIAMVYIGPGSAVRLAVLRTLVSSMVLGTFLTPTFVLSFSGGVVSALVMVLLLQLCGRGPFALGLVGVSVGGAVSHLATQVGLVYLLFIRNAGVLWLWPWLGLSAVVTGIVTGMIAIQAVRRLEDRAHDVNGLGAHVPQLRNPASLEAQDRRLRSSLVAGLRPELKVAAVVLIGLVVVVFSGFRFYLAVFGLLFALAALGRISPGRVAAGLKRVWALLLASLLLPIVFSPWGRVLFTVGPLRVTEQGLHDGVVFATRILLLFFATALLAQTTPPRDVAIGLERLLAPLRVFRVRPSQLASSLALSWSYFPVFWQSVRQMVKSRRDRRGWFNRAVHLPGDIVADLYTTASLVADRSQFQAADSQTGGFPPLSVNAD